LSPQRRSIYRRDLSIIRRLPPLVRRPERAVCGKRGKILRLLPLFTTLHSSPYPYCPSFARLSTPESSTTLNGRPPTGQGRGTAVVPFARVLWFSRQVSQVPSPR